jgi:hypothetical protein
MNLEDSLKKRIFFKKRSNIERNEQNYLDNLSNIFKISNKNPDKILNRQTLNNSDHETTPDCSSQSNKSKDCNSSNHNNTSSEEVYSSNTDDNYTSEQVQLSSSNCFDKTDAEIFRDFEFDYYRDEDCDNYSKLSDDFENRSSDYAFDDSNNDDETFITLPYSRLDGFSIREMFDLQGKRESLNEIIIDVDSNNVPLYDHQSCVMTRGINSIIY